MGAGGGDWVLSSARIQHLKSRFAGERKPRWQWRGGESGAQKAGEAGGPLSPWPGRGLHLPLLLSVWLWLCVCLCISLPLPVSVSSHFFLSLSLFLHLSFVSPEAGEPPELGTRPSDTSSPLTGLRPSAGAALPVSGLASHSAAASQPLGLLFSPSFRAFLFPLAGGDGGQVRAQRREGART